MGGEPAEIIELPGVAVGIAPVCLRPLIVFELAADAGRDFDRSVGRAAGRERHGPIGLGGAGVFVGTIPGFSAGFDREEPKQKARRDYETTRRRDDKTAGPLHSLSAPGRGPGRGVLQLLLSPISYPLCSLCSQLPAPSSLLPAPSKPEGV